MASLERHSIPIALLRHADENPVNLDNSLGALKALSIITEEAGRRAFHLHRLVQDCARRWVEIQNKTAQWQEAALQAVFTALPASFNFENWPVWEAILPHAEVVSNFEASTYEIRHLKGCFLTSMAGYDRQRARFEKAIARGLEALMMLQESHGWDHADTIKAMETLVMALKSHHDYDRAAKLARD